jgi:hypothetical protein
MKFNEPLFFDFRNKTSRKTYKVINIDWDTDGEELNLPVECLINIEVSSDMTEKEVEENISNAITNMSNFCHNGFDYTEIQYQESQ